jgi:hypothetical protein
MQSGGEGEGHAQLRQLGARGSVHENLLEVESALPQLPGNAFASMTSSCTVRRGVQSGADDDLIKPFSLLELRARWHALVPGRSLVVQPLPLKRDADFLFCLAESVHLQSTA